jgi:hypothetical protein
MPVMKQVDTWAIVELMGHVALAGRLTKPSDSMGLWQLDVPEGEDFRTEFFGSQSVYRIRIVSEEIARAYVKPAYPMSAYDAPILTRAEHEQQIERMTDRLSDLQWQNQQLRERLTMVQALPSGNHKADGIDTDYPMSEDDED